MKMTWHQCVRNMREDLRGMIVAALDNDDAETAQDAMIAYSAVSTWFEQIHKHGVDESTIETEGDDDEPSDGPSEPEENRIAKAIKQAIATRQRKRGLSMLNTLLTGLGNGLNLEGIEAGVDNQGHTGRKSKYTCDGCKRHVVTIDKDPGITAFALPCISPDPGCHGMMTSSLYKGVPEDEAPDFEWRKPSDEHVALLTEGLQGHVKRGGLVLYPAGDPDALPHKMQLD